MGCWNETCFITGGAIKAGDPVVSFVVQQACNPGTVGESWMPVTFPITGDYDDYGGVKDPQMIFGDEFIKCWTDLFNKGEIKISERGVTMSKYETIGLPFTLEEVLHQVEREYLEHNDTGRYMKLGKLDTVLAHKSAYDFLIASYKDNQDRYNFSREDKSMLDKVKSAAECFSSEEDEEEKSEAEKIFKKHGFYLERELLKEVCGWYSPDLMPPLVISVLKASKDHELLAGVMQELRTLYMAMMELRRPMYTHGTGRGSQQDNTKLKTALASFEQKFFGDRLKKDEEEYAEWNDPEDDEIEDEEDEA